MNARERKKLVEKILRLLREEYGEPKKPEKRSLPLVQLIRSILAEDASDEAAEKALSRLEEEFVDWNEVRVSTVYEIAEALGSFPNAREKAERIHAVLQAVFEKTGQLDLTYLGERKPDEIKHELLQLEGVTPQAAAALLLLSFDIPAIPIDYSMGILVKRMGLVDEDEAGDSIQELIERSVKKRDMVTFYYLLKEHAGKVCTPGRKNCSRCVLAELCAEHDNGASGSLRKKASRRKKTAKKRSKRER